MYFCYVDESGDCGKHNAENPQKTGTPYFILAGIVVAANKQLGVIASGLFMIRSVDAASDI